MNYRRIPFVGRTPPGVMHSLEGLPMSKIARIPVSNLPKGVPGLVRWIKTAHPVLYRQLDNKVRAVAAMHGLGVTDPNAAPGTAIAAADTPGWGSTILSTIKELLPTALSTYQQTKVFDLQLKRAQLNQPPLDINALSDAAALRVGVDSQTRNTGLWIAGGAVAALFGYKLLFGRR
jgi:hypothetical protein